MIALGFFALCLTWILGRFLYIFTRHRADPGQREKNRRTRLYLTGRLAEGMILDLDETSIYYQYTVNGVPYSTAQDFSTIEICLPENRNLVIGTVWVKFDSNNPANSIVVCEQWSGFRASAGSRTVASSA